MSKNRMSQVAAQRTHSMQTVLAGALLSAGLCACDSAPTSPEPSHAPAKPLMVGADRDSHGCIGSAGYAWCEKQTACVRPWELAKEKGFNPGAEEFESFCAKVAK